ncbi:hypothetical protein [Clostridium botulinum]|uniref:hypothetical protein n=1 Tax=Clostridium botulinum TaxID=1491 RepID=UPI0007E24133|nr:hypothetical protein [Clostridium botulinum]KEI92645.1 hypothetical protein N491_12615 [Clostridium botulinum B2 275]
MKVEITNIPKDKFQKVQSEIFRILIKNGFEDIETIIIEDGLSCEFEGFELEITIDKSNRPVITSSSVCG